MPAQRPPRPPARRACPRSATRRVRGIGTSRRYQCGRQPRNDGPRSRAGGSDEGARRPHIPGRGAPGPGLPARGGGRHRCGGGLDRSGGRPLRTPSGREVTNERRCATFGAEGGEEGNIEGAGVAGDGVRRATPAGSGRGGRTNGHREARRRPPPPGGDCHTASGRPRPEVERGRHASESAPGVAGEIGEQVHGPRLEVDHPPRTGKTVQAGLHEPSADVEAPNERPTRRSVGGHCRLTIGRDPTRSKWRGFGGRSTRSACTRATPFRSARGAFGR